MYTKYFGLNAKPFSITSDPGFLYLGRKHQEALDSLIYGISNRSGFIEITGEVGSGKTTLCRALLRRLPPEIKTAYIFNSNLTESQFMQTFMGDLGMSTHKKNRHTLYSELNEFLINQLSRGNNVVLIIDEAQNLTVRLMEQIRMLSNLETDKEKLLQIILAGQPELREKLQLPALRQLRQRISIRYHIQPLDRVEITDYVSHRLAVGGAQKPDIIFTVGALDEIFEYTKGVPRLINIVCDKTLLASFVHKRTFVDAETAVLAIRELEGVYA